MLVLTRKAKQSIMIGDGIEVTVVEIRGDAVRLAIDAPRQSPMPTLSAPRRMKMRSRGMLLYTPARRGRVTLVPKSPTGSLT